MFASVFPFVWKGGGELVEMVVDKVYDLIESAWFQALIALAVVMVGVQGVVSPGNWFMTNAPVLGQLTGFLPDVVHQAVGALFILAGGADFVNKIQMM